MPGWSQTFTVAWRINGTALFEAEVSDSFLRRVAADLEILRSYTHTGMQKQQYRSESLILENPINPKNL